MANACEGHPVGLLLGLAAQLHHHIEEAARSVQLTGPQAQLLMELDQPARLSDLAASRSCDPSSVTTLVQRLERDGFVAREVDPDDGRARRIRLTPKGRRARTRFAERVGEGRDVVARMSDHERLALVSMLAPVPVSSDR